MTTSKPSQTEIRGICAREQRRHRRGQARVARAFEVVAALIPGAVLLLHLTLKSSSLSSEAVPVRGSLGLPEAGDLVATQQLTVVPEPSAGALFVLGCGALFFRRQFQRSGVERADALTIS